MGAIVSSRTPEGRPILCLTCGLVSRIEPSYPGWDAPCPGCGQLHWFDRPAGDRPPRAPASMEASRCVVVQKSRPLPIQAKPTWTSSLRAGWKQVGGILGQAEVWFSDQLRWVVVILGEPGAWFRGQPSWTEALWRALEPLTLHPPFPPPRRQVYGDLHPIGMPRRIERQEHVSFLGRLLLLMRSRPRRAQASPDRPTSEPFVGLYDAWLDGCP
jgi:hypothetical protein